MSAVDDALNRIENVYRDEIGESWVRRPGKSQVLAARMDWKATFVSYYDSLPPAIKNFVPAPDLDGASAVQNASDAVAALEGACREYELLHASSDPAAQPKGWLARLGRYGAKAEERLFFGRLRQPVSNANVEGFDASGHQAYVEARQAVRSAVLKALDDALESPSEELLEGVDVTTTDARSRLLQALLEVLPPSGAIEDPFQPGRRRSGDQVLIGLRQLVETGKWNAEKLPALRASVRRVIAEFGDRLNGVDIGLPEMTDTVKANRRVRDAITDRRYVVLCLAQERGVEPIEIALGIASDLEARGDLESCNASVADAVKVAERPVDDFDAIAERLRGEMGWGGPTP